MAQTRRKTKHRGNAAGVIESRGRTGRKPTAAEKSGDAREVAKARKKPTDPRDRPPTIYGGKTTIHLGGDRENYLLLPVIPKKPDPKVSKAKAGKRMKRTKTSNKATARSKQRR